MPFADEVFMRARFGSCLGVAVVLALLGCDSAPMMADAGSDAALPPDGGPPFSCERAMRVDGVVGETVSVTFDTAMTETRSRDLGLSCGNPEAELRWAPQEVVELHVPGSGPVAIAFDTIADATDAAFNTLIQVRRDCAQIPAGIFPPTCFDDTLELEDYRARGEIAAIGGDVLFFFVTGYSHPPAEQGTVDQGVVQVDFTVRANAAPTLSAGFMRLADADAIVGATGMDADSNVAGVAMSFRGPDGELLDIYGASDGPASLESSVYYVFFEPRPTGTSFDTFAEIRGTTVTLAAYLRGVRASAAILRVFDQAWATSAPFEVPIGTANLVGYQAACDGMNVCRDPMTCIAGICDVRGAALAVCEAATVVTIPTPTDVATSVMRTGSTGAGYGQYGATCAEGNAGIGAETVYTVAVPAGTFDLIVSTDLPGTGTLDTVVYIRTACPDPGTEVACNDDIARADQQSLLEILDASGTYSVFVEKYAGLDTGRVPHDISFTLRPVRATGQSCDPAGAASRCATGACPAAALCP